MAEFWQPIVAGFSRISEWDRGKEHLDRLSRSAPEMIDPKICWPFRSIGQTTGDEMLESGKSGSKRPALSLKKGSAGGMMAERKAGTASRGLGRVASEFNAGDIVV